MEKCARVVILLLVCVCMAQAQVGGDTVIENQDPSTTRPRLRIVFEGVFRKRNILEQQTMYPYGQSSYGIEDFSSSIISSTNPWLASGYQSSMFGYGPNAEGNTMLFGFDANFTRPSGRRFVMSARMRLSSDVNKNMTKETWFQLHSDTKKQSGVVFDFAIKVVR